MAHMTLKLKRKGFVKQEDMSGNLNSVLWARNILRSTKLSIVTVC
jgi:hypothetical protein